ncbi:THUMP domain-containing protein 1 homolog [Linum perenne]
MATDNAATKGKKRKQYLPHNKAVKKKGSYPLHPGVQGFFITCDGGRECQACFEAINVLDTFYDELVNGSSGKVNLSELSSKPVNKKIKFAYSDDEEEEGDEKGKVEDEEDGNGEKVKVEDKPEGNDVKCETQSNGETNIPAAVIESNKEETEEKSNNEEEEARKEATEPPVKKQCTETKDSEDVNTEKVAEKSIDKLIEEELKELGDKSKNLSISLMSSLYANEIMFFIQRLLVSLDSGCNGVVFIQMRKRDGDPSPKDVAQLMMTSAASTKKHMSRFLLRVLPIEVSCYPSEEDISRAVAPVFAKYFPADASEPQKFAVMYGARANSGLDRAKVINAVAKSVPSPHKVDLSNPDKTIVVEIVKTVCLIGVVEKYKELAKYNLRQLTSPPPTTAVEPKAEDN